LVGNAVCFLLGVAVEPAVPDDSVGGRRGSGGDRRMSYGRDRGGLRVVGIGEPGSVVHESAEAVRLKFMFDSGQDPGRELVDDDEDQQFWLLTVWCFWTLDVCANR
jgi:hypothetical protein